MIVILQGDFLCSVSLKTILECENVCSYQILKRLFIIIEIGEFAQCHKQIPSIVVFRLTSLFIVGLYSMIDAELFSLID